LSVGKIRKYFEVFVMESGRKIGIYIRVFGLVQGVGFRASTYRKARELGLKGYVKNLPSGYEVEIVAEADEDKILDLLEWAKNGPPGARVDKVEYETLPYEGKFKDFKIEY
jgi:acylphosphatase